MSDNSHICLIKDDLVSNYINANNIWEPHLYFFYKEFIKKDYYIIDGGANIGSHTLNFAKLAYEGQVYSFEPQNIIFNVLSTNILINGLSDIVQHYRKGLGEKISKFKMSSIEEQHFGNSIINWGGRGLLPEEGETEVVNIDSLNLPRLDLIKLDIQGMEEQTIIGGKDTILNFKPILILEAGLSSASKFFRENGPVLSSNNVRLFDYLAEFDYVPFQISSKNDYFFGDTIFLNKYIHQEEINFIKNQTQYNYKN